MLQRLALLLEILAIINMINLIPNQEKKKMVTSFYFRLGVLSLYMLSISLFIAILALLPAYLFSNSKNKIASQKLEIKMNESIPVFDKETGQIIKEISDKLKIIEDAQKNKFSVSEKVINAVFAKKSSSIKITQISYENNSATEKKIRISGSAPSREILLAFRKALEGDTSFKSVDLPISNFVKGANLQFFLTLTPA